MTRGLTVALVISDDGIFVVAEATEVRVVAPGLLDELELTLDARIHAEQMDAALTAVIVDLEQRVRAGGRGHALEQQWIEQWRAEHPRASEQPMRFDHAERLLWAVRLEGITWIAAAHVRPSGQPNPSGSWP